MKAAFRAILGLLFVAAAAAMAHGQQVTRVGSQGPSLTVREKWQKIRQENAKQMQRFRSLPPSLRKNWVEWLVDIDGNKVKARDLKDNVIRPTDAEGNVFRWIDPQWTPSERENLSERAKEIEAFIRKEQERIKERQNLVNGLVKSSADAFFSLKDELKEAVSRQEELASERAKAAEKVKKLRSEATHVEDLSNKAPLWIRKEVREGGEVVGYLYLSEAGGWTSGGVGDPRPKNFDDSDEARRVARAVGGVAAFGSSSTYERELRTLKAALASAQADVERLDRAIANNEAEIEGLVSDLSDAKQDYDEAIEERREVEAEGVDYKDFVKSYNRGDVWQGGKVLEMGDKKFYFRSMDEISKKK